MDATKLDKLRTTITENLRVQRDGQPIDYINVGTALQDACAKQNHAIFARRGCGKTLLLHHSSRAMPADTRSIYLNCEDFKRHSFPNVLIEILRSVFSELDRNLSGWFGKKKRAKEAVRDILQKLNDLQAAADQRDSDVRRTTASENSQSAKADAAVDVEGFKLGTGVSADKKKSDEIETSFRVHENKLEELDRWLPRLKELVRTFFRDSNKI
jgi:hypothetical protein